MNNASTADYSPYARGPDDVATKVGSSVVISDRDMIVAEPAEGTGNRSNADLPPGRR